MAKNSEEKRQKDRTKEIVAYSVTGFFWLGGLAMCVLGMFAYNSPVEAKYNSIYQAEKNWATAWGMSHPIDFRIVGTLVCLLAMCFFLGFVNHFANRYEKDAVRRSTQEKRLAELLAQDKEASEAQVRDIEFRRDQAIKAAEEARKTQLAAEAAQNRAPVSDKGLLPPKSGE